MRKVLKRFFEEYGQILQRNLGAPIVLIVAIIVTILLVLGQRGDAFFLASVITINVVVGIVQEIRARRALHQLELLMVRLVRRVTPQGIERIAADAVMPGDRLEVLVGDQIPSDGHVEAGRSLEVDESLLTGESRSILKKAGERVVGGSFVVAGGGTMVVEVSPADSQAGKMAARLRHYDYSLTPLQLLLTRIIRWLTYLAILLSAAVVVADLVRGIISVDTVTTIVTAAISVVPEGLLLASTLLLAYGSVRLARKNVLVQRATAIEGLGRLQILCVDKTGTLTQPTVTLERIIPLGKASQQDVLRALSALIAASADQSVTMAALAADSQIKSLQGAVRVTDSLPFSSSRKFAAVRFVFQKERKQRTVALGAAEVLAASAAAEDGVQSQILRLTRQGRRVLLVVEYKVGGSDLSELPQGGAGRAVGLVVLENPLRHEVQPAIDYLQQRGVVIKVISGDSPGTVQFVARALGIRNADRIISGDQLARLTASQWNSAVGESTIFARVFPEQKERIIKTLRRSGFTGMVGDGVNDALALKRADLGIAMFEGAEVSRHVADVVLLDNSFAAFPAGMALGAQVMLVVEMITTLFFNKIVYGLVLLVATIGIGEGYPFFPRQITFMNLFIVGLPTVVWSFFPPMAARRRDPKGFLRRTLRFAIPNGIISGAAIAAAYFWTLARADFSGNLFDESSYTVAMYTAIAMGVLTFLLVPFAFGAVLDARQRRIQYLSVGLAAVGAAGIQASAVMMGLFDVVRIDVRQLVTIMLVSVVAGILQAVVVRWNKADE